MSEHTPGPWRYELQSANDILSLEPFSQWYEIYSIDDVFIASTSNMSLPNARLIAAAPDLLEACRMFVDAYTHEALDLAHSKAQAAIAKAGGEDD